jgi:hypothetical protein
MVDYIASSSERWVRAAPWCWRSDKSRGRADAGSVAPGWVSEDARRSEPSQGAATKPTGLCEGGGSGGALAHAAPRLDPILDTTLVSRRRATPRKRSPSSSTHRPDSRGLLIAATFFTWARPGPGQQRVDLLHGPAIDELGEDVSQISLRVEAVDLCGLCRPPNYANGGRHRVVCAKLRPVERTSLHFRSA